MTDEKPVPLKKLKTVVESESEPVDLTCIVHFGALKPDQKARKVTDKSFDAIRNAVLVRQSQVINLCD